jgi:hypothetical protein
MRLISLHRQKKVVGARRRKRRTLENVVERDLDVVGVEGGGLDEREVVLG